MKLLLKKNKDRMMNGEHAAERGFTLIEVMVSLAIFVTVLTVAAGSIISIIDANRKTQALKSVIDNLNFALEDMSRSIRVGSSYFCGPGGLNPTGPNCAQPDASTTYNRSFAFKNVDGVDETISYSNGKLYQQIGVNSQQQITADQVVIDDMRFYVTGAESGPTDGQPRVVITVKGHAGFGEKVKYRSDFFLQTSITQRSLDR